MNQHNPPGRFTRCPTHMPRETAQSYLGRLTAFFAAGSPKEFCRDFMLDLRGIQHGEPEALRRLAAITGADPEDLVRWTPRRIDKAFMVLDGEEFHTRINPRHVISICPACANEDIAALPGMPLDQAAYGRCEWMIGVVDCCASHKVKLVSHRAPVRTAEKLDVGYETGYLLEELRFVQPEPAEPDPFQLYVLGRAGAVEPVPSPLLDPLSLVTVTQLCHAAGLDLLRRRGINARPNDAARRAAGFEMLGHGPEGLERIFLEMRRGLRLSEMTSRIMPRLLEYLHEAHHQGRGLDGFVDTLVDICFRNMPYAEGQVLLGRPCPKRWLYDFPSAMAMYGIGRHHLHAFVLGTPELAAYVGERRQDSLIRGEVADRLFVGRTPFLSSAEAVHKLGWDLDPRSALRDLIETGIIQAEAGASITELPPIFSEPGIDASLSTFFDRFEHVDPVPAGMASVDVVKMSLGITSRDLWQVLASGRIRKLGFVGDGGPLRRMRVDTSEVLAELTGVRDPITTKQAAAMLGIGDNKVRNLVINGFLVPTHVPEHLGLKVTMVFSRGEVEGFLHRYVPASQASAMLPESPSMSAMRKMGLQPAIDLEGQGQNYARTILFRRSDVEACLAGRHPG